MLQLRESGFFKTLCILLATLILYTSCSPENMPQPNECPPVDLGHLDSAQAAEYTEQMLEYAATVDYQEDFNTFAEFHQTLFGESEAAAHYVNTFETESAKYTARGFEGYVNDSEYISNDLKTYYINYAQELESFISTQQPDLEAFTLFMNSQTDQLASSGLCDGDQEVMRLYLASSQGYGNWFYKKYFHPANFDEVQFRGCNFFQAILCGLLALTVGVTVGVIAGVILFFASIFVNGREVEGDDKLNFSAIAGFALGVYVGIKTYQWCCSLFDDEDEGQLCLAPTGSVYTPTDCNQFTYRIFGPSNYGPTEWNNGNTNPAVTTTPFPAISMSIPEYGATSDIAAQISCIQNLTEVHLFSWEEQVTFSSGNSYFPLSWEQSPPLWFDYEPGNLGQEGENLNIIEVLLSTPTNTSQFTYSWHVNAPHTILGGGGADDNWVMIEIMAENPNLTTGVTVTNTCTGQSESLSQTTLIQ